MVQSEFHDRGHKVDDAVDHKPVIGVIGGNIVVIDPVTNLPIKDSGTSLSSLTLGIGIQGSWDANTNTPTLASGVGIAGHGYIVSVAGTTTLDGISEWKVNDTAWFDGTASVWRKIDRSDPTLDTVIKNSNNQTVEEIIIKRVAGQGYLALKEGTVENLAFKQNAVAGVDVIRRTVTNYFSPTNSPLYLCGINPASPDFGVGGFVRTWKTIESFYNGTLDIGTVANSFKDLHLGGIIYAGGGIFSGDLDMNSNKITECLAVEGPAASDAGIEAGAGFDTYSKAGDNAGANAHEFRDSDDAVVGKVNSLGEGDFTEITDSGLTASQIVETDGSKKLISAAKGTAYNKAFGTGSGDVCEGDDARIINAVSKTLFDAQTILQATADNTPAAITIAEQQIVGRITAGNIKGLSVAEMWTLLGGKPTFVYQFSGTAGLRGSQTAYINLAEFFNVQAEAQSEFGKCRLIKLIINVPFNTLNSASTFQLEINGTPVGTAITYGATVTGRQSQVESITVAAGDLLDVKAVLGGLIGNSIDILEVTGIFEGVQ